MAQKGRMMLRTLRNWVLLPGSSEFKEINEFSKFFFDLYMCIMSTPPCACAHTHTQISALKHKIIVYCKRRVIHRVVHLQQVRIFEPMEMEWCCWKHKWQFFFFKKRQTFLDVIKSILKSGNNFATFKYYPAVDESSKITACEFTSTNRQHQRLL